jgi:23S rRNA pseudouridine1911/1915/1917 synthase
MGVSDRLDAKQSVTTFQVLERFEAGRDDDGFTLLECKLYTGRTHQIRVHMAYIRHPVVGDQLYGTSRVKSNLGLERQFLHSYRIKFTHPATGEEMELIDPLSPDLAAILERIAEYSTGRTPAGEDVLGQLSRL